jgi:hypothetical protein
MYYFNRRFKLHLQVMDHTGSTSFIVFDRNVQNFVGKSVQDLIDAQVHIRFYTFGLVDEYQNCLYLSVILILRFQSV